jgi:hypothetical protein
MSEARTFFLHRVRLTLMTTKMKNMLPKNDVSVEQQQQTGGAERTPLHIGSRLCMACGAHFAWSISNSKK